jgi:hypothetical protein
MWEFPHGQLEDGESHQAAARRILADLTGICGEIGDELLTLRHAVTNHRITMVSFDARYRQGNFHSKFYVEGKWLAIGQIGKMPLSSPQRRLTRTLC